MTTATLQTTTERLDRDRARLRVEVPESALRPAIDAAYRRWAGEIKVPGFRKGKVPKPVIDARVGSETIRQEALREALPDLYKEALRTEDLEPIAPPDIEVVAFEPGAPLVFEATIDLRPEVDVPDFGSIHVEAPPAEVTDEDIDQHLERLRERFAELETVGREARRGDHVLIDIRGSRHGEPVEGATTPDFLYEVGSHTGPPKLDEEIEGNRPGAILKFTSAMPEGSGELAGQEISYTVLLKEVKAKKLPKVDDDFAKTVGEFDGLHQLKEELRTEFEKLKKAAAEEELGNRTLAALVNAARFEPPDKLVESEFEHRLQHIEAEVQRTGISLDEYARRVGSTTLELRRDIRAEAARAVKADLLLEEIARREKIEVTREDIGREIALAVARSQRDPEEVSEELTRSGQWGAVAADIMRRKALDLAVERVNVTGRPVKEKEPPEAALEAGST